MCGIAYEYCEGQVKDTGFVFIWRKFCSARSWRGVVEEGEGEEAKRQCLGLSVSACCHPFVILSILPHYPVALHSCSQDGIGKGQPHRVCMLCWMTFSGLGFFTCCRRNNYKQGSIRLLCLDLVCLSLSNHWMFTEGVLCAKSSQGLTLPQGVDCDEWKQNKMTVIWIACLS